MKQILHRASGRIVNDFGWLRIHASFRDDAASAHQKRFGSLVILDDATMIPGGRGFRLHPHDNMEIISWVLSGTDEHNDSKNGITLLHGGQVQLMSAGTGIQHAENNHSQTEAVHMFQIWIEPGAMGVDPNYQVMTLKDGVVDQLHTFVSPDGAGDSLRINQQAYLSTLTLSKESSFNYNRHLLTNGVYVFVLVGHVTLNESQLMHRDAMGIPPGFPIALTAVEGSRILFIEVPEGFQH
jgi:quercetin 2,3-dioxygenase